MLPDLPGWITQLLPRRTLNVSPDGRQYLDVATGKKVPRPFSLRLALPKLLGTEPAPWILVRAVAIVAIVALSCVWCHQHELAWGYGLAVLGLSGVVGIAWRLPILVDAPAMALALGAAVSWEARWYVPALLWVIAATLVKESAGIFAAAWAWSWVLLVPLVLLLPALWWATRGDTRIPKPDLEPALGDPVGESRSMAVGWFAPTLLLSWGPLMAAAFNPSWQLGVVVGLAWLQLVRSTDRLRLMAWAFPTVLVAAAGVWPWAIAVFVVAAIFNPFRGEGI